MISSYVLVIAHAQLLAWANMMYFLIGNFEKPYIQTIEPSYDFAQEPNA